MHRAGLTLILALLLTACATSRMSSAPATHNPPSVPGLPPSGPRDQGLAIVAGAQTMLGQPYRYGGAAPGGFDCSGLVVYAARSAGILLPRTTEEQVHAGVPVARAELRAGDLVFMHLRHKALHVGIAIDNIRFVHAPAAGGHVRIDSLDVRPYAAGFATARRVTVQSPPG